MTFLYRFAGASALALLLTAASPRAAAQCAPATATALLDANNVAATLANNGVLFFGDDFDSGYEVPKGSGVASIYAGGLWAGGKVDGEVRTAAATYGDYEFWAGPIVDGDAPDCAAFDRIYVVSQADIDAYDQTGTATDDLAEWPANLGAPVADGDGNEDNYDLAAGDRPELQGAAQTAWWVMNDLGGTHVNTGTQPIGIEVQVQAFSFLSDGAEIPAVADESTFYQYTILYEGESTLEEFYVSLWLDVDLGDATDDYVGSRPEARLGYTYNADDNDVGGYGTTPPAIGVYGLEAFSGDLGNLQGGSLFAARSGELRSPVSSVMYFINQQNTPQSDPNTGEEVYNYLRARWIDGSRLTFGGSGYNPTDGTPTAYAFSGDAPDYWSENDAQPAAGDQPNPPGDRRSLQNFGPFELESGNGIVLTTGILWTRSEDGAIASLNDLVDAAVDLSGGTEDAPEPLFGNTLASRSVTVPANQTATLAFTVSNPGEADLLFTLEPGTTPGSSFLDVPEGEMALAPGASQTFEIEVAPNGAASATYPAELIVRSNDRNVVSAEIPVSILVTPAVAGEDGAEGVFALRAPAPNPAARSSRIEYQTAATGPVRLTVVDALGREVAVVVDDTRAAGAYEARLPLATLPAGVYVVRLQAGEREATQPLTVVR